MNMIAGVLHGEIGRRPNDGALALSWLAAAGYGDVESTLIYRNVRMALAAKGPVVDAVREWSREARTPADYVATFGTENGAGALALVRGLLMYDEAMRQVRDMEELATRWRMLPGDNR